MGLIPRGWEDDHDEEEAHRPEQAVRKLREGEKLLAETASTSEIDQRLRGEIYVTQIEVAVG